MHCYLSSVLNEDPLQNCRIMFSYKVNQLFYTLILFVHHSPSVFQNSWFQSVLNLLKCVAYRCTARALVFLI